jgi:hypothetical protein
MGCVRPWNPTRASGHTTPIVRGPVTSQGPPPPGYAGRRVASPPRARAEATSPSPSDCWSSSNVWHRAHLWCGANSLYDFLLQRSLTRISTAHTSYTPRASSYRGGITVVRRRSLVPSVYHSIRWNVEFPMRGLKMHHRQLAPTTSERNRRWVYFPSVEVTYTGPP